MATNDPSPTLDKDITKPSVLCPLCKEKFKEPKMLDCLHHFCKECLKKRSLEEEGDMGVVKCSTCGRETMATEIDEICTNMSLWGLAEEAEVEEQLQGSEVMCQLCEEENPGVSLCVDCSHFLCQECHDAHRRLAIMKSHRIHTLEQLWSGEVEYKSKLRDEPRKCKVHAGQVYESFCSTCEKLVCPTCIKLEHGDHELTSTAEAVAKCRQEIAEMIAKVEESKEACSLSVQKINEARERLNLNVEETKRKIREKAEREIEKVKQQERQLKEEAERIYNDALFLSSLNFNPRKNQRH